MRRSITGTCLALAMASIWAVPAAADSASVDGTGSYEQLVVNNTANKLIFKIHAPGGECAIKYVSVKFRDRDGTTYAMNGGCYPGSEWNASLERGAKLVDCGGFSLKFNETQSVWTGSIPRTCLKRLAGPVKETESWVDDYTPNVNEVPATKYVKQG